MTSGYDFGYENRVNVCPLCPLLSGEPRSPRGFNPGEGFGISAVHNGLRERLVSSPQRPLFA